MKKKLFVALILILLFVFGLLMYDFSDEVDVALTGHKWYLNNHNELYVLSLKDNKFSYVKENGDALEEYISCDTYHYNSNVSILKLKCNDGSKKMYISTYDDKELVLSLNGEEKTFYSSKEIALVEQFKLDNDLTDSDYNELLSISFNEELIISYKKFINLYKGKKTFYIGLISNDINYENVYNYQVLNNLIGSSSKKFYLINIDELTEEEKAKLSKLIKIDDDIVHIYEVKNKKIKNKLDINAVNKNDLNNYKSI